MYVYVLYTQLNTTQSFINYYLCGDNYHHMHGCQCCTTCYRKVPAICACAYRQDHLSPCQNLSSTLHAHRTICTLGIYVGPVSIYLEPNIHLQSQLIYCSTKEQAFSLLAPTKISKMKNQRENEIESSTTHFPQDYPLLLAREHEMSKQGLTTLHPYTDSSCQLLNYEEWSQFGRGIQ